MINKISNNAQLIQQEKNLKNNKNQVSFSDTIKNYIKSVNNDQIAAKNSIERFLKGEEKDIHNTMISIQKADISLQLMMQIRNKLITAYQEIMRIQV